MSSRHCLLFFLRLPLNLSPLFTSRTLDLSLLLLFTFRPLEVLVLYEEAISIISNCIFRVERKGVNLLGGTISRNWLTSIRYMAVPADARRGN
jgi:hypothetical protein